MKKALLLLFIACLASETMAQSDELNEHGRPKMILSVHLGGDASLISFGLDRLFFLRPAFFLSAKVGLGYNEKAYLSDTPTESFLIVPQHLTCNFGRNKSFLELGIGGAWITGNDLSNYTVYPIIGYRRHPFSNPGFSFRVWMYYPFFQDFAHDNSIMLYPGFSFGLAF